ncbi:MATE family efflux transporter [uncultured Trichococcus sp.]|uniref:MATE family efflux transporter n=1 Tax=uncultured Trichococcus sp. TaxID=189665 RepID=UPI0029C64D5D|nr:MATE family efflux transporter [uncultured Trichococcus sp.]
MEKTLMKDFSKYVSLNILGMIGVSFYILADTYFIAKALGANGIAALNFAIPAFSIVHGIGLMIGIGGATRFSILKSQNQNEEAESVFSGSLKLGSMIGLMLILVGLFGSRTLSSVLGANADTLPLTQAYMATILSFAVFFILNNTMLAFVRNDNNPRLAMTAMLVGSFSNVILDYVFLFPLGMGMFGAAFATSLSPIISLGVLSTHFAAKRRKPAFLKHKMTRPAVLDILTLGSATFITEVSSAVVLTTFNLLILGLEGNRGVAAYGIVANLAFVAVAIFTGLGQGVQPLVSRYYGSRQWELVKKVKRYAVLTAISIALLIYAGTFAYADTLINLFNNENDPAIAQLADQGMKIYFLGFFFVGINIVTAMFLSATEKARAAFIISILRGLVVIVPLAIVFGNMWQMTGIWSAFVLSELIVAGFAFYIANANEKGNLAYGNLE